MSPAILAVNVECSEITPSLLMLSAGSTFKTQCNVSGDAKGLVMCMNEDGNMLLSVTTDSLIDLCNE